MANKKLEADVEHMTQQDMGQAEMKRRSLVTQFREQEKVAVSISPLYKPYFGKVMTVTINGISCAVPVDGKTYKVPFSFAEEVEARKRKQDELLEKKKGMGNVQNNFETSPGELTLF